MTDTTAQATAMPRVVQITYGGRIHLVAADDQTACGRTIPEAADFGNADEFNHEESACARCYPALVDAFEKMLAARDAESYLAEVEADAMAEMDAPRVIDAEGIKPTQVTGPGVTTVELLFDPVAEKWQVRVLRTYKREIAESLTENFGTDGTMACIAFEALAGRVPAGVERKSEIAACPECQAARVWSVEDFAFVCVCTDEEARLSAQGLEPESGESYGQDAEGRLILNRPVTLTHKVETYRLA